MTLFAFIGASCALAMAQSQPTPKWEAFGGYSLFDPLTTAHGQLAGSPVVLPDPLKTNYHGIGGSLTYNFNNWLGLTFDASGNWTGDFPTFADRETRFSDLAVGPRLNLHGSRVTPFLEALAGVNFLHPDGFPRSIGKLGLFLGGGFNIAVTRHFGIEPIRADYVFSDYRFGSADVTPHTWLRATRLESGVNFMFGGGPPPPPATAACTVQPSQVFAGEPVTATATGSNFNPKRALRYSWSGTGVSVSGSHAATQIDTTGLAPGSYVVTANLTDGTQRGIAACSTRFTVEAPHPPTISCSADPASLQAGATSTVTATASSPDSRPLTYSYSTSVGTITGSGSSATLYTQGVQPGPIIVTCNVRDDRTPPLTAAATTAITVEAPPPPPAPAPPPPEETRLAARLSLHSIYFQTARPTIANPNGGLLPSQKLVLDTLAGDFENYLKYEPNADLILTGHADHRGSAAFNQALTERRVDRAKKVLVADGVAANRIETQAVGSEQPLSADQVRAMVEGDPNLTPADRAKVLRSLRVLVLANNRRVDVTLSTTGQQSVRRYPFNAEDFLSLISPQGVARRPARRRPPHRRRPKP